MITKKKLLAFICLLSICSHALPQASVFKLSKIEDGHYTFPILLNHKRYATAMLESAAHAMLIDSAYISNHLDELGMKFTPCTSRQRMNLGGKYYRITHKAKGELPVGDSVVFRGEVYILANYSRPFEASIPIQHLYHQNGQRIITLNLKRRTLEISSEKPDVDEKWEAFHINYNTYLGMPAIQATFSHDQEGNAVPLTGNYNIDLGNAAFLYLFKQNKVVKEWLSNAQGIIQETHTQKGATIEYFIPKRCTLLGFDFKRQVIGITGVLPRFTTEGSIGLKFFEKITAIFDFEQNICYLRQK